MAASIYATPPPDLNGEEDTSVLLSDTSNSSQTNSSNHSQHTKAPKRSLLVSSPSTTLSTTSSHPSVLGALSSLFDSTPDMSKKRRKQTTPIRISATATELQQQLNDLTKANINEIEPSADITEIEDDDSPDRGHHVEEEKTLQKIFLKNLSQLQSADQSESAAISAYTSVISPNNLLHHQQPSHPPHSISALSMSTERNGFGIHHKDEEDNDNEVEYHNKYSVKNHLQDDKSPEDGRLSSPSAIEATTIKKDFKGDLSWNDSDENKKALLMMYDKDKISKPEDWLSIAGLPFPFPPEAAAALSASGYLPQMPMLSSSFGNADGMLSRGSGAPPLRIFNPEAYCDLCNKEFCNKYFLKTHKANKHGIYEPPMASGDMPSLNQLSQMQQMSQVLQMQSMQQFSQQLSPDGQQPIPAMQQNQQQSISQEPAQNHSSQSSSHSSPQENIFCDVCFKKFSSNSSLKKHRLKIHEIGIKKPNLDDMSVKKEEGIFHMPDGFREDYQIEQEDTNFTPQIRKLSQNSIQQLKESNFSLDKLKRLGVVNPEAFCEICCKEYCNKYFLRTHKLKRHGIFLPPDDMKDDQQRAPWHYVQTSPLNLMMGSSELQAMHNMHLKKQFSEDRESMKTPPNPADFLEMKREDELSKDGEDNEKQHKKSPGISQQDSDAISMDLQKLQSMILQLNELSQHRNIPCAICGKEMDNQYMLHAHMMSEHANLNNNNIMKMSPRPSSCPSPSEFEVCKHCDKEFSNIFMLKQHLIEMHGMAPMSPLREGFVTPDRPPTSGLSHPSTPTQGDRKPIFQMTPTSSYCEICNKELCNKYFMKTHMQRMHGIEIENGAQIGGVVCNICNKELCSKYFLRVHKHNTHGIVEEGSPLPQQRPSSESVDSQNEFSLDLKPGEVSDLSNRYYSHFTEVCPLCSRRFRSAKWLKAHLMSDHGKAGTDKLKEIEAKMGPIKAPSPTLKIPNGAYNLNSPDSMNSNLMLKNPLTALFAGEGSGNMTPNSSGLKGYQCSFCSFSTPILAILFIHERSHSSNSAMNLSQNQIKSEGAVSIAKEQSHTSQPTSGGSSDTPTSTPASTPIPSIPQETIIGKPEYNHILNNMANLTQRPAIYALPQESGPLVMQSFLLEESATSKLLTNGNSGNIENKFVPSVVVLPVKERISSPITISFTLTPA